MRNNRQLPPLTATGSRLIDQVRDVRRFDMSLRFQQTAWLKSRSGSMVLAQQDEAQTPEFFRFGFIRGGPGHAAAPRLTPEEAHEYWPSGILRLRELLKIRHYGLDPAMQTLVPTRAAPLPRRGWMRVRPQPEPLETRFSFGGGVAFALDAQLLLRVLLVVLGEAGGQLR